MLRLAGFCGYTPVASKKAAAIAGGTTAFWEYTKAECNFFCAWRQCVR